MKLGGLLDLQRCVSALEALSARWLPEGARARIELDGGEGIPLLPPGAEQPIGRWVVEGHDGAELAELARRLACLLEPALLLARVERDALTGLPARRLLRALLQRWRDEPLGLLLVDIDELSAINRRHGCEGGDELLRRVAALLERHRPQGALLARWGGDEFALLWPRCDEGQLERLAAALLEPAPGLAEASLSIGLATGAEPELLFARAEAALARSLESGGGRCTRWTPELPPAPEGADRLAGLLSGDWGRDYRNVSLLLQLLESSNASVEAETILTHVLDWMVELSGTERGLLFLAGEAGLELRLARDRERRTLEGEIEHSKSLLEQAAQTGRTQSLIDRAGGSADVSRSVHALGLHTVLCVPIRARGEAGVRGVLYMDGVRQASFTGDDVRFFEALAGQLCAVLERAALQEKVERLQDRLRRRLQDTTAQLDQARQELAGKYRYHNIITRSRTMKELLDRLDRVAATDVPVLIEGESGTGKELVARALHHNGPRAEGPFIAENCGALQETLLESELFGHRKGAFTGALTDRQGLLAGAHRGTLFLDEVGEMTLGLQKKLLRFLQEGEFRPLGSTEMQRSDVRVISATHRNLESEVGAERFRADLFYRLNVVRIVLPPLRERREDIPLLVDHFLDKHAELLGRDAPELDGGVLERLVAHDWPGNVRELENVVQRALVLCGARLSVADLSLSSGGARPAAPLVPAGGGLVGTLAAVERQMIEQALEQAGGNRSQAARELGIPRTTLLDRIRKLGLDD